MSEEWQGPLEVRTNFDTHRIEVHTPSGLVLSLAADEALQLGRLLISKGGWLKETCHV